MSRPIRCQHGRAIVAADPRPILDFGWWASNGPTAGYVMRLAAATAGRCPANGTSLRISLDVARLAAAPYAVSVVSNVGTSAIAHNLVAFHQGGPFGRVGPDRSWKRPPCRHRRHTACRLPPEAYRAMATPSATHPPVTGRIVYRPRTTSTARSRRRGGMSCG